uniref:Uncharacterized protein n=1 Tax=Romanomermis culicivorax TaxID=13658 RepID=A0A915KPZ1_ROMCU
MRHTHVQEKRVNLGKDQILRLAESYCHLEIDKNFPITEWEDFKAYGVPTPEVIQLSQQMWKNSAPNCIYDLLQNAQNSDFLGQRPLRPKFWELLTTGPKKVAQPALQTLGLRYMGYVGRCVLTAKHMDSDMVNDI